MSNYLMRILEFQSTLPHGERPPSGGISPAMEGFNPRSHMGSDSIDNPNIFFTISFNPRSHMGSDLIIGCKDKTKQCFNPRSHMGSDTKTMHTEYVIPVSIHAPTWGATYSFRSHLLNKTRFNPRSHMGSDSISLELI